MKELNIMQVKKTNGGFFWPWEKYYKDYINELVK